MIPCYALALVVEVMRICDFFFFKMCFFFHTRLSSFFSAGLLAEKPCT